MLRHRRRSPAKHDELYFFVWATRCALRLGWGWRVRKERRRFPPARLGTEGSPRGNQPQASRKRIGRTMGANGGRWRTGDDGIQPTAKRLYHDRGKARLRACSPDDARPVEQDRGPGVNDACQSLSLSRPAATPLRTEGSEQWRVLPGSRGTQQTPSPSRRHIETAPTNPI